jgi:acyl-coenzyme A thioesterase PaaI-like protein
MAIQKNRLARAVSLFTPLPTALRGPLTSLLFNSQVRFAGTGGLRFEQLTADCAVVVVRNRRKVQNHIGGVHAAAMALLAETASGAVFGMNVGDDCLPLLKSMEITYLKRAQGDLRAVATLNDDARARIATEPNGNLVVPVTVTDESGEQPIQCRMTWAWVPKKR